MKQVEVPVLIVGGGGCGLTSAITLAEQGIQSLLIERHAATGTLPKARYINQRSMEVFRQFGLDETIYVRSMPLANISRIRWCTSLAGDEPLDRKTFYAIDSFGGGSLTHYAKDSPVTSTLYPQVRLEPLLTEEAKRRLHHPPRFNHELLDLREVAGGVISRIRDRTTGTDYEVHSAYVIAADGGRSVGPMLGGTLEGRRNLVEMVTVYFRADLSDYWDDDHAMTTWFVNPEGGSWSSGVLGKLGPTRFDRHSEEWMFHFSFRPDDPARFDEAALLPRMRELLKLPDLSPDIIGIGHWSVEGVIADRFRFGRVFLAGDAAHRHPPTTGLGLNSAIQDAHNLAWKLAAVLKGQAGDGLLDSYEAERRPVAARNVSWALMTFENHPMTDAVIGLVRGDGATTRRNFEVFFSQTDEGATRRARLKQVMDVQKMEWQAHDLELGFDYAEGGGVVPDATPRPPRDPMGGVYLPTTRPGHRLPHAWLTGPEGQRLSTLDLAGTGAFVLITDGTALPAWQTAVVEAQQRFGIKIHLASIGNGGTYRDAERDWLRLSQLNAGGAILVRPDNHVGWRRRDPSANPTADLAAALAQILRSSGGGTAAA